MREVSEGEDMDVIVGNGGLGGWLTGSGSGSVLRGRVEVGFESDDKV